MTAKSGPGGGGGGPVLATFRMTNRSESTMRRDQL